MGTIKETIQHKKKDFITLHLKIQTILNQKEELIQPKKQKKFIINQQQ